MKKVCKCLICKRNIKNPDSLGIQMGRVCAKRYFIENKGSYSDLQSKIASSASSLVEKNIGANEEKFISMLNSIPFQDPNAIVQTAIVNNKLSMDKLLKQYPKLGGRTDAEILLNLPDKICSQYPKLKVAKDDIANIADRLAKNFGLALEDQLYSGANSLMDAQTESVRLFLQEIRQPNEKKKKLEEFGELKIDEILREEDADEAGAKNAVKALKIISTLIPDKYKKNVPPVTVIIKGEKSSAQSSSAADLEGGSKIALNLRKNIILQAAEAFHEYIHLIEIFNPKVMKYTNSFLKKRRTGKIKTTIKKISDRYDKQYLITAGNVQVYDGNFIDPYVGRTYGDLDGPKLVATEILTVGCEALFLEGTNFCVKDRDYFDFIANFLKGNV
jgi:hypothetical protein